MVRNRVYINKNLSKEMNDRRRNVFFIVNEGRKIFINGLRKPKDLDYYSVMRESQKRLEAYINTGNDELLVDVANFCSLVFKFGNHPKKHLAVYKAERFEDK